MLNFLECFAPTAVLGAEEVHGLDAKSLSRSSCASALRGISSQLPKPPSSHSSFQKHDTRYNQLLSTLMFSRLSQIARHLSQPLPNFAHVSAAIPRNTSFASSIMATQEKKLIHTAACLIIGDEVLGGKVCRISGKVDQLRT
jgi:hypothetical protein